MTSRTLPRLAGLLALAALPVATACWSVPADPGANARLRSRAHAPGAAVAGAPAAAAGEGAVDAGAAGVYYTRCAQCHEAYPPGAFSAGEWPLYVDRYGPRAGLYGGERARVLRWLQANAAR
jgi:cytochrome c5